MALIRVNGGSNINILPAAGKYYETVGGTQTEHDIPANGVITSTGNGYIVVNTSGYTTVTNGSMGAIMGIGLSNGVLADLGGNGAQSINFELIAIYTGGTGNTMTLA